MSVTKVTVNGMDMSSDVTLSGTTPTLTIGDAGAEDAAIVFDGNAQDFHIGLDDTADDLVIGKGSALGTTTAVSIDEDLLVTTHGGITMAGTTPTLTIGDAGAEDAKIVFDGNAQDFHIGLDDTADDLVIGLGSALGTTTHMAFTEDGEITKPLQPAFLVENSAAQNDMAVAGYVTIVFDQEILDVGANFASNTFTAPVTGKYQINAIIYLVDADAASTYLNAQLVTSNRTYRSIHNTGGMDADGYLCPQIAMLCDMDASDTAYIRIYMQGGSAQTDATAENSRFGGYLAA